MENYQVSRPTCTCELLTDPQGVMFVKQVDKLPLVYNLL